MSNCTNIDILVQICLIYPWIYLIFGKFTEYSAKTEYQVTHRIVEFTTIRFGKNILLKFSAEYYAETLFRSDSMPGAGGSRPMHATREKRTPLHVKELQEVITSKWQVGIELPVLVDDCWFLQSLDPNKLQWSAVTVTPSGIGKGITVTDCHSNSSFKMTHI